MKLLVAISLLAVIGSSLAVRRRCAPSITTASGSTVKKDVFCTGELIFEDNFNTLNFKNWEHESTLGGGGNWEFQWYTNNRSNSFTQNGVLHIRPTLTSDIFGEQFLTSGTINIQGDCTNAAFWGCERAGSPSNVVNPVRSARLRTKDRFSFKYGRIEINAKMPAGDWLWPALWMLPTDSAYGPWPASGEIDIMESRGNRNMMKNGVQIGTEQMGSTLHFGPSGEYNGYPTAHFDKNTVPGQGFNMGFHRYQLEWTPDRLTFKIDDIETGTVHIGDGFWQRGGFGSKYHGLANPWVAGERSAPFDQEFHILINLAVGGIAYFPDDASNPDRKPWSNTSPTASTDFWNARHQWLNTWNYNVNTDSHLQVDYVRVYAL